MLSEYAVDRAAIGANWRTFKDLIDRFGADRGRLISRLPAKWEKKVIQAARDAGVPDVRMTDIVERLRNSKHKVVDFNRTYDHEADWIDNALREHGRGFAAGFQMDQRSTPELDRLCVSATTEVPNCSDGASSIYVPSCECHRRRSVQHRSRKNFDIPDA